ncbi:hypothetical protein NX801_20815 [Streptomyces sp. LP05-1]|uniref:Uncharacterized protein n=1 Tax=Streptomyces pyxinae TaxID=2970734 RepID=A0ABT2CKV4_9ACTN|nr:hypothetical protein [Streptomyces sp. LP05-1]MCS0638054.1 hypothetical protein [Streptomyces sp. LP05-1]
MRSLTVPLTAALVLGGSWALCPATAGASVPQAPARTVHCGNGHNDLALMAVTTRDGRTACVNAGRVSDALSRADGSGRELPLDVSVGGVTWRWQERQEPGAVNPHLEATSGSRPGEVIRLVS